MTESSLSRKGSSESLWSQYSTSTLHSELDRLPFALTGPLVWRCNELQPEQYVIKLSDEDIDAVQAAVASFKLSGLSLNRIEGKTFPLPPKLVQQLSQLSSRIYNGIGVVVVRGLGRALLHDEDSVIAFVGIASHVCAERATDAYANQTLSHVRDATYDSVPGWAQKIGLAGSKLPAAMEFHADRFSGDVLALCVKNTGGEHNGGDQFLASFWSIYNELLEIAPDVIGTLASPDWPFEIKDPNRDRPYVERGPVIFFSEGKVINQLVRAPLLGSPRIPRSVDIPKLSPDQFHALKVVEETAQRLGAKLDRMNGDIQFVNNLAVLHARSSYGLNNVNGPSGRHLLRMFLRDPALAWKKPEAYLNKFDDPFNKERPETINVADVDPWRNISGHQSHG